MHPARAALLAAEQEANSNASPAGPSGDATSCQPGRAPPRARVGPLPPDVEEARKARINRDLIDFLNVPAKSNGPTTIQGIGLYTHVAAPKSAEGSNEKPSNPVFLPIGGPNRVRMPTDALEPPVGEEVMKVWEELEAAVDEGEKHMGQNDMTPAELKKRYGVVDMPEKSTDATNGTSARAETIHSPHTQAQFQQALEHLRKLSAVAAASKHTITGGTNEEHKDAIRGNMYHEDRDPRKR
jgi:hypothetical protein